MPDVRYDADPHAVGIVYRAATMEDANEIAALHADSWRRHYRGAYLDSYLDGDVVSDRLVVWTSRLASPQQNSCTVIADSRGEIFGFAHVVYDEDPKWGALVDNLHVRHDLKANGIGTRLLSEAIAPVLDDQPAGPIHLWVLDQNQRAQSFYESRGGTRVESAIRGPFPGGGSALGHRYFWPDMSVLVARDTSPEMSGSGD
jgi:GNAT superfamily N-acetyltransferase